MTPDNSFPHTDFELGNTHSYWNERRQALQRFINYLPTIKLIHKYFDNQYIGLSTM